MLSESRSLEQEAVGEAGTETTIQPLERVHDRIIRGIASGRPRMVFDAFWREGELALMFGAPGTGKSLLAVRIANSLATGGDFPWFQMETEAANTLYVDLSMSDRQFAARHQYTGQAGEEKAWKTSRRLFCGRPDNDSDLLEWLEARIEAGKLKYVVIDDLSALMTTCDGTRETMAIMRALRRIRDRFDVSILVVMQSGEPRDCSDADEKDLGRQRSLCRQADSVFCIGREHSKRDRIYLMQTRSRSSAISWTRKNGVFGTIYATGRSVDISFDERMSDEEAELILAIHRMHESGMTYRKIADELGISKSRASRLKTRWFHALEYRYEKRMAQSEEPAEDEGENDANEGSDVDEYQDGDVAPGPIDDGRLLDSSAVLPEREFVRGELHGPRACPFLYDGSDEADRWREFLFVKYPGKSDREIVEGYAVGDDWCRPPGAVPPRDPEDPFAETEIEVDVRGNRKYVEERHFDGKPSVYYQYRPNGKLYRFAGERMELANPNLFGRFADVGRDRVPKGGP